MHVCFHVPDKANKQYRKNANVRINGNECICETHCNLDPFFALSKPYTNLEEIWNRINYLTLTRKKRSLLSICVFFRECTPSCMQFIFWIIFRNKSCESGSEKGAVPQSAITTRCFEEVANVINILTVILKLINTSRKQHVAIEPLSCA